MNNQNLGDFESFDGFDSDKKIKHPVVTFFHIVFRLLAVIVYIFGGIFSSSFIGCFVGVVLLLSLDFWTVKNITGRIMVGLRWWNYVDETTGESKWVFEVSGDETQHKLSSTESKIFWTTLVAAPLLWVLLFLVAIFRFNFKWLILVIIGISLTGSNLFGYMRCKMGKTDLKDAASGVANSYMRQRVMDNIMGMFKRPEPSTSQTNLTV